MPCAVLYSPTCHELEVPPRLRVSFFANTKATWAIYDSFKPFPSHTIVVIGTKTQYRLYSIARIVFTDLCEPLLVTGKKKEKKKGALRRAHRKQQQAT